jgi:hypothetical protein
MLSAALPRSSQSANIEKIRKHSENLPHQASIFAALNAWVAMKSLLGSASSPISIVNTRSALIASFG